jgi:hypothetical protein
MLVTAGFSVPQERMFEGGSRASTVLSGGRDANWIEWKLNTMKPFRQSLPMLLLLLLLPATGFAAESPQSFSATNRTMSAHGGSIMQLVIMGGCVRGLANGGGCV